MKLILALFLCCVTYVIASPTCSSDAFKKCQRYDPRSSSKPYIITEEDLESFCKLMDCSVDVWDRCRKFSGFDELDRMMYNQYKKIIKAVCGKQSLLRQKYLDTARCLNEDAQPLVEKCGRVDTTAKLDKNKLCKELKEITDCQFEVIENECGRDAREVYAAIYPNAMDLAKC